MSAAALMAATVATAKIDLRIMCLSSGCNWMCFSHPAWSVGQSDPPVRQSGGFGVANQLFRDGHHRGRSHGPAFCSP
jgi:hypothetical protein